MTLGEEAAIQNTIRLELSKHGVTTFRANSGQAWTGDATRLPGGDVLIRNARPFHAQMAGFSDLFGFVPVEITPDMVGEKIAAFVAIEVKSPRGRVSENQEKFLNFVARQGGFAGVARSSDDALKIIGKDDGNG